MENAGPGSRGTGSRDVENKGSGGKHGVAVKHTGSKKNARGTIISPNIEFSLQKCKVEIFLFQIAMKINRRETHFSIVKGRARWKTRGVKSMPGGKRWPIHIIKPFDKTKLS